MTRETLSSYFVQSGNGIKTNAYLQLLFGLYLLTSAKHHCSLNQLLQNHQKFCKVTPEENTWLEASHGLIFFRHTMKVCHWFSSNSNADRIWCWGYKIRDFLSLNHTYLLTPQSRVLLEKLVHTSPFLHTCHMSCPSHSSRFYQLHDIG